MNYLALSRVLNSWTLVLMVGGSSAVFAQETDITQTPNAANAGIKKSYPAQIGAGRGDTMTVDSSMFIIRRDPARSVVRGRQLFQRKFTMAQGLGPRTHDGVGDIESDASHGAGLADSCAACHGRPQGAAGFGGDVFTRTTSRDAPHLFGLGLQEMLADEITQELRAIRDSAIQYAVDNDTTVEVDLIAKNSIDYGELRAFSDGSVDTSKVEGVNADLRVRPFFAEGSTISIREFLVGAFNAEMGLEAYDPDLAAAAAGGYVITPSGMVLDGSLDSIEGSIAANEFDDPDGDGVTDEIPISVVDHMEFYLLNYFKPARRLAPGGFGAIMRGRKIFAEIGCAECHVPNLRIDVDRRVADFDTRYDEKRGNPFNFLHAVPTLLFDVIDDGSGYPALKPPRGGTFLVKDIYTDFKRHDLGPNFWERNFDDSIQKEFMTEPLWGVGSTPPYGHDGRSNTLEDVIMRHGGEAEHSRDDYDDLNRRQREDLIAFLRSLVLFSPPATSSDTNPANPSTMDYPLNGHGSLDLGVLFNDPSDEE